MLLAIVTVVSLSYYILSQLNQTQNEPSLISTPTVPEFTVEVFDNSYDVPTTYSTDPYTGDNVTHGGYHAARRTIEVKIKNQPFIPFTDSDGREIKFYYNIRIKGHYEEWGSEFDVVYNFGEMPTRSNSEYTAISYHSDGTYSFNLSPVSRYLEVSPDGEVDFQVQALIGFPYEEVIGGSRFWFFTGETSEWSNTQTLRIP